MQTAYIHTYADVCFLPLFYSDEIDIFTREREYTYIYIYICNVDFFSQLSVVKIFADEFAQRMLFIDV